MFTPIKTTDFSAIKLRLASEQDIHNWSYGEVLKPETINYRTQRPEKDGLFCEKIFGPTKDWECYCGKYKKIRYKGIVCDKCGVEVTRSIVRRERMGHIDLAVPVSHIWFLRGVPSRLGLILDISMQNLEKVIYFANFIITNVDEEARTQTIEQVKQEYTGKKKSIEAEFKQKIKNVSDKGTEKEVSTEIKQLEKEKLEKLEELELIFKQAEKELKSLNRLDIISEADYHDLSLKYGHVFEAGIGAEVMKNILKEIDSKETIEYLENEFKKSKGAKKDKLIKRLKLFKNLEKNNIRPESMILSTIPVIPPDLRPMVPLDGGRFATSDSNDLYRRVINRNNRLKQLITLRAPEVICRNEKRMLQEAVDALIDNGARHGKTVTASTGQKRMLKSLADQLKGKQGRFRQNLLGKRTDYSGRSVIVVGPKLKLDQCGLPKKMALELFKPFIISKLIQQGLVHNVRSGNRFVDAYHPEVFDILEEIVKDSYVLLNRAPTLHRLGIQAFKPILIEGKAIQVHPLVCAAFNADFDGDQMAVHVPLTDEAKHEADTLMLASRNLLKPSIGEPIANPTKDMVWGCNYITNIDEDDKADQYFSSPEEAKLKYGLDKLALNKRIKVLMTLPGKEKPELVETCVGRILFNEKLPEKLQFVNQVVENSFMKTLISKCLREYGQQRTAELLDDIKELGFFYITLSGLSWGMDDIPLLKDKPAVIAEADKNVAEIREQYDMGLLTKSERYAKVIEIWTETKDAVIKMSKENMDKHGSVFSMVSSGSRGSWSQLGQIVGMKGLVASPSGEIIELPVKGNFKEGFDVLEYFISSHGSRKGLADTALRTANSGYLTRRLVDVAQDVIVKSENCGTSDGLFITKKESESMGRTVSERILGRFLAEKIVDPKTNKTIIKAGELVNYDKFDLVKDLDLDSVKVRSVLKCESTNGVCQKCYGWELGSNEVVKLGIAVGIIAAQSIGEPGTQLTMRTFHSGGVAGSDITQGLPRVEEIFEARVPKREALISEVDGKVKIEDVVIESHELAKKNIPNSSRRQKLIKIRHKAQEEDKYTFAPNGKKTKKSKDVVSKVKDKEEINKGTVLFINTNGDEIIANRSGIAKVYADYVSILYEVYKDKEYLVPLEYTVLVKEGEVITKGCPLTSGSLNLQTYYGLRDLDAVQKYIIKEIQYIYSSQGQKLNDKHIETIIKQMFSRIYIKESGDTELLPGDVIERNIFLEENKKSKEQKLKQSKGDRLILGISKVSLSTSSFLSAASFIETAKVLIQAAISGKIDDLDGLKENVIIGRLIPAGTGFLSHSEKEETKDKEELKDSIIPDDTKVEETVIEDKELA